MGMISDLVDTEIPDHQAKVREWQKTPEGQALKGEAMK